MSEKVEGVIKKYRREVRRVWWKPWTWFGKTVEVADEGELTGLFFLLSYSDKDSVVRRDTATRWTKK